MFVSLARVCVVYIVQKVVLLWGDGLSQLMGMARKECVLELQSEYRLYSRKNVNCQ